MQGIKLSLDFKTKVFYTFLISVTHAITFLLSFFFLCIFIALSTSITLTCLPTVLSLSLSAVSYVTVAPEKGHA
jgi:hypothetical protein